MAPFLVIGLLAIALIGWLGLPVATDRIAGNSFANAPVAFDLEAAPTPWLARWSQVESGALAGRGEGLDCSLPPAVHAAFSRRTPGGGKVDRVELLFRQACVAHDLCYRHGAATYGYSQNTCDMMLSESSFRICRQVFKAPNWCRDQVRKVLGGVVLGGSASYRGILPPAGWHPPKGDDGSAIGQVVSTVAEYDPQPSGNADFALPRYIDGICPNAKPGLLVILGRPGGLAVSRRCGEDLSTSYAEGVDANVSGDFASRPSLPWLTEAQGSRGLLQWCRLASGSSTAGRLEFPDGRSLTGGSLKPMADFGWYRGCRALRSDGTPTGGMEFGIKDAGTDPDATTLYPVPGATGAHVPLIGLRTYRSTDKCSLRLLRSVAEAKMADLPFTSEGQPCWSWLAEPPLMMDGGDHLTMTIFSRTAGADGDYQTLRSKSFRFDASGVRPLGGDEQWGISERQEPLAAVPVAGGVALMSLHREGIQGSWWAVIPRWAWCSFLALLVAAVLLGFLKARWAPSFVLIVAAAALLFGWVFRETAPDFRSTEGGIVLDLFASGERIGTVDVAERSPLLGTDSPPAAAFLQDRISIVDPRKVAQCQTASPPPGCEFNSVAVLTAYRLNEKSVRADLLLLGIDAVHGRAALRRIASQSLGSPKCDTLGRATKENGGECYHFVRSGMMAVSFDGGAVAGLSTLILNRERLTENSILVKDLLGGSWTPLTLEK
jgi:hypothetical protein